ncbi:hypothetical protein [Streptomyces sp. 7-21]|uniref:hypothetical protein n=1 Tax=Streptomyces sp. 7-21 TaxID=2802283 RepID=UPI00191FC540|nr:hypothetical protein [Streptomyces sp. 7-21]MBL1066409.1 hypothetical protein [Streptomyces sp. 7-21]
MFHRKTGWLRAVVPAAVVAMALTGCNSDDSSDEDTGAAQTEGQTGQDEQDEQDSGQDEDPAGDTEPGGSQELALGETSEPLPYEDGDATANLAVTLDSVEVGNHADLEGTGLSAEDIEGKRPAFVTLTVEHTGGDLLEFTDPSLEADLFDAEGLPGTFIIGGGSLEGLPGGCPEGSGDSVDIAEGDQATFCRTWLLPENTDPGRVVYTAADDSEVVWSVG